MLSSDTPLRAAWWAAGLLGLTAAGGTVAAVAWPSTQGPGLAAITAVVALVAAIQTCAVAIVGEYVVRTYREVQARPTWVTRRTIHGTADAAGGDASHGDSRAA